MTKRIVFTILIVGLLGLFHYTYESCRGPLEAHIAVSQLEDSGITYSKALLVTRGIIPNTIDVLLLIALLGLWVPYFIKQSKEKENK